MQHSLSSWFFIMNSLCGSYKHCDQYIFWYVYSEVPLKMATIKAYKKWFEPHQRPPVVSLSKKLYLYCLVLVGSRNGFEHDITIELK